MHRFVRKRFASSASHCPFKVLGLKPTTTTYKEVQLAFRKLALRYHPDTANNNLYQHGDDTDHNNGAMMSSSSSSFTEIREAFEAIVEGPNGEAILRNNNDYTVSSSSFNGSYGEESVSHNHNKRPPPPHDNNNLFHSSINPQILREVAQVAEEMNPGGLDKGGMWQYANMVNRMAKEDGLPPLQLGREDDDNNAERRSGSVVRRRRKRR
jgi:hypothetical protein